MNQLNNSHERSPLMDHIQKEHGDQSTADAMAEHNAMFLVMILCACAIQVVVLYWKKYNAKSFKLFELLALWVIPMGIALQANMMVTNDPHSNQKSPSQQKPPYRFEVVWLLFTVGNAYISWMASRRPLSHTTPRLVYRWFQRCYQICYLIGIIGYVLFMADFIGLSSLPVFGGGAGVVGVNGRNNTTSTEQSLDSNVGPSDPLYDLGVDNRNPWFFETAVLFLFYALYFGILARDLIDLLSSTMASGVGYFVTEGFPAKHLRSGVCALCGDAVNDSDVGVQSPQTTHQHSPSSHQSSGYGTDLSLLIPSVRLSCRHSFHEPCIRGWLLIGKKDMCPYCKEKCAYKDLVINENVYGKGSNVWDVQQDGYLWVLDTDYIKCIKLVQKTFYFMFILNLF
ncbi:hypothetical protein MIR68_008377 [Amoeboaphelidium protococcarum]|nr:hypothetical protein MIR68_008377 [Amoeboaphelidium protococcarum]